MNALLRNPALQQRVERDGFVTADLLCLNKSIVCSGCTPKASGRRKRLVREQPLQAVWGLIES
jgi:hypothetical protein